VIHHPAAHPLHARLLLGATNLQATTNGLGYAFNVKRIHQQRIDTSVTPTIRARINRMEKSALTP
jgi:hypothetical protein